MTVTKTDQPLESFYALYKLSLQFENRSPRTIDTNTRRLSQFATWARQAKQRAPILADFSVECIQAYAAYLRTKKRWDDNPHVPTDDSYLSPFSIQDHVRTLKAFSSWLYREGHTHENVLQRLPMPKAPKLLVEPLTEDEIKKVFANVKTRTKIGARDYAILLPFLDTGIRNAELCTLTLGDVHLEKDPGWIKVRGKGDKERIVVLGKAAHHALLTYKTFVRTEAMTDSFFTGWKHGPMTSNTIQRIMDRIARQAGIPRLHAHVLRHTAATQYLVSGGDAISLQHKLGHTTLAMTSQYVHLAAQHLAVINERVSPMDNGQGENQAAESAA